MRDTVLMYPVESASANLYKGHVTGLAFPFFPCQAGCTPLQMSTLSEVSGGIEHIVTFLPLFARIHHEVRQVMAPCTLPLFRSTLPPCNTQSMSSCSSLRYVRTTSTAQTEIQTVVSCARQKNGLVWVRTDQ